MSDRSRGRECAGRVDLGESPPSHRGTALVRHPATRRLGDVFGDPGRFRARVVESASPSGRNSVTQAVATLAAAIATPGHRLLTDGAGFVDNPLVPHHRLLGHQQVTDALLVAIAKQHHATLATLDGGLSSLAPDCVTLIPTGS